GDRERADGTGRPQQRRASVVPDGGGRRARLLEKEEPGLSVRGHSAVHQKIFVGRELNFWAAGLVLFSSAEALLGFWGGRAPQGPNRPPGRPLSAALRRLGRRPGGRLRPGGPSHQNQAGHEALD